MGFAQTHWLAMVSRSSRTRDWPRKRHASLRYSLRFGLFCSTDKEARALLGWDQQKLARASNVGIATVRRIEGVDGPVNAHTSTTWRLQKALEKAGIIFIESDEIGGPGVRLAEPRRARAG